MEFSFESDLLPHAMQCVPWRSAPSGLAWTRIEVLLLLAVGVHFCRNLTMLTSDYLRFKWCIGMWGNHASGVGNSRSWWQCKKREIIPMIR